MNSLHSSTSRLISPMFINGCLVVLLSLLFTPNTYAQLFPGKKREIKLDTIFYPFYNGIQMIEIDRLGKWEADVNYHEMTQPRALEWSSLIPRPKSNEILFRDTTGNIVKAYNTTIPLDSLTKSFRKVPIQQKNNNIAHQLLTTHASKGGIYSSFKIRNFKSGQFFNGYYLIQPNGNAAPHLQKKDPKFSHLDEQEFFGVGLIDSLGNIIVPTVYLAIAPLNNELHHLIITNKEGCGIMTPFGDTLLAPNNSHYSYSSSIVQFYKDRSLKHVYDARTSQLNSLEQYDWVNHSFIGRPFIPVRKDWKYGLLDSSYNEIIPPKYDFLQPPYKHYPLRAFDGNKWGFLNQSGDITLPFEYDDADMFKYDGHALVKQKGKYFCIDTTGALVNECNQTNHWNRNYQIPESNFTIVGRGSYGVIDRQNNIIIPVIYGSLSPIRYYKNGKPAKEIRLWAKKDGRLGVIDLDGNVLLPFNYDKAHQFIAKGYCMVENNRKWGLIDSTFTEVFPCQYDALNYPQGNYTVFGKKVMIERAELDQHFHTIETTKQGVMDMQGNVIIAPHYDQVANFSEGLFRITVDNKHGFINPKGEVVIPIQFEFVSHQFSHGRATFVEDDKYGFIDQQGKKVVPAIYSIARDFEGEITVVGNDRESLQLIDKKGKIVSKYTYTTISSWIHGKYLKVVREGKYGIVNHEGKEIVPCKYDKITSVYTDRFKTIQNGVEKVIPFKK